MPEAAIDRSKPDLILPLARIHALLPMLEMNES
jgi:two-component system chemotaxis response regulator CheB